MNSKKNSHGNSTMVEEVKQSEKFTIQTVLSDSDLNLNLKKNILNPVSDDSLDYLDSQMDNFNETNNLGEKISIYDHLKESVNNLEKEVVDMLKIIDTVDMETFNNDDSNSENDKTDINDDIANIEKMIEGLKEEEIMQIKIKHFERIADVVRKCKAKCHTNNMKITKCN